MVLQLMVVIVERDAALLENNTSIAKKMAAWAEWDVALLQRDALPGLGVSKKLYVPRIKM